MPKTAGTTTMAATKIADTKAAAVKGASARTSPVKAAPVKAAAVKAAPAKAAPVKAAAVKASPIKPAPVKAAPTKPAAAKPAAVKPAAVKPEPATAPVRPAAGKPKASGSKLKVLTEADIVAMPDSDYMNESQLEFFRARLHQMERDLLANAGETTEHLRETVIVPDPADRATIEEEHALELRTRDRERKLLKKIQQSLARIDSGEYGWCEETGDPIGVPRLLARPTATLSLEAQQRRELRQKLYGD
jgi:DnaK suppressor protein